jgi:hypothetical protein
MSRFPAHEKVKAIPRNNFLLNTCVGNVLDTQLSHDACRVVVRLPHDRAPTARHETFYFSHERGA